MIGFSGDDTGVFRGDVLSPPVVAWLLRSDMLAVSPTPDMMLLLPLISVILNEGTETTETLANLLLSGGVDEGRNLTCMCVYFLSL